jgi:hypothetical protein
MAAGDIDPHAVRLGATRWLWHGYRSARVMRAATWAGEVNPARAIALVYPPAVPAVQPRVDKQVDKPAPRKAVPPRTALDKAAAVIRDNPHLDKPEDKAELARLAGVSAKTVQRARNGKP